MKTLLIAALLLMGAGTVWAETSDCPPGTYLTRIGTVSTANDTTGINIGTHAVATTGHLVRASNVACTTTACTATLYDSDLTGGADTRPTTDARVVAEPGCIASSACFQSYDPPLSFSNGIAFADNANVTGLILYECRPR
jgi:hypothetical protein